MNYGNIVEIGVLGNYDKVVSLGVGPNLKIRGVCQFKLSHVPGIFKQIPQPPD